MRKPLCFALAVLASATLVAPVRAQDFLMGSVYPIPSGDLRMIGAPMQMFGRDGRPDRTGGAFRMGYGLSDALGVDAKAAFFNGVTLLGGGRTLPPAGRKHDALARPGRAPGDHLQRAGLNGA